MRKTSIAVANVIGAVRTLEYFALFPVSVEKFDYTSKTVIKETRWLEKVRVRQMYRRISWTSGLFGDGYDWNNEEFIDAQEKD